ncbi:hypothetical protein BROC_01966 [Candidatus Brocadiaceae bacterium]|nr:hypothetical protein BROC_01966 [Candidatus Brocadiaceae bacterium]
MPLRKQNDVPKVPKTRKKTIDKALSATPAKKVAEMEYAVRLFFRYDAILDKQYYVIAVATVKEFSSLNYEVSVDVRKAKDTIDISILGLNTRQVYLVEPKPAYSELLFQDLFGKYTVNVIKQDGSVNSAVVEYNIYKKEIEILETFLPEKKNNRLFTTFSVAKDLFTFQDK